MKQMTRSTPARPLTACLSAARSLLGTLCLWLLVLNAPPAAAQDYTFTAMTNTSGSTALFFNPCGVAVNSAGSVYVIDSGFHIIRKLRQDGLLPTLAGLAGNPGSNDGTGSNARFNNPSGAAVDSAGNVYVADTDNHTIRKVTPGGGVTTLAGLAGNTGSTDAMGSTARFNKPNGVAVDSAGNVYVADTDNHTIRKVTPGGEVTTLAGLAGNTGSTDAMGSAARFNNPHGVAVDSAGNVYVADYANHTIRKVTPGGGVTTIGGLAGSVGSNDGTGSTARFKNPGSIAVDSAGNVYVAHFFNATAIRRTGLLPVITSASTAVGTLGYAFSYQITANNTPTSFNATGLPAGLSINPTTGLISGTPTVAGTTSASLSASNAGGMGVATLLITTAPAIPPVITSGSSAAVTVGYPFSYQLTASNSPTSFNATGLPVGLSFNPTTGLISGTPTVVGITSISLSASNAGGTGVATLLITMGDSYTFTTLAGLAGNPGITDATGSAARFHFPSGVAVDSVGNVYVGDYYSHTIRKVTPGGVVTTLAGLAGNPGITDAMGSAARFKYPAGVAVDSAGNVYVGDTKNHTIRKVTPGGGVSTLAGLAGSYFPYNDGQGSAARFNTPYGMAVDGGGNVYVAEFYGNPNPNHTIRKVTPGGVVTTLAGLPGIYGISDGTGTDPWGSIARFTDPAGVAVDNAGNVYVADSGNHTIRKVTPGSLASVSTLAGLAGTSGGTDATGRGARFNKPGGVAVDNAGNVYVADYGNHTIRKVTPGGVVTTIGGLAGSFGNGFDGTGSDARFSYPNHIAVDSAGNVYVADCGNHTIRKGVPTAAVGPPVIISASLAAGTVGLPFSYNITALNSPTSFNATGLPAGLSINPATGLISGAPTVAGPSTVTLSASNAFGTGVGTLLITTAPAIPPVITSGSSAVGKLGEVFTYQITALNSPTSFNATGLPAGLVVNPVTGLISGTPTVAGTPSASLSASNAGGTGVATLLITVDGSYTFTTLAGLAGNPGSNDDTGNAARFSYPSGVAVDNAGTVYVADYNNHTLRKVTPGGVVTTLAGLAGNPGSNDATGSAARFNNPSDVAVDSAGNVYVADTGNHTIRKVTSAGVVTTIAGLAGSLGSNDDTGSAARFKRPKRVAVDGAGNVYVADTDNHTIRMVTPGGVVTTLAGLAGNPGTGNGNGNGARFNTPLGVAVDSAGNVYVGDFQNQSIRKVTSAGVVTTLAGSAFQASHTDGTGSAARFKVPRGVAVDTSGNVYVADFGNATIRKVTPGGVVTTLAGLAGSFGSSDGTGSAARFYGHYGVAVDSAGNVYVADSANSTIRKGVFRVALSPPVITSASTAGGTVGQAFTYQITANNSKTGFNATGLPAGLSINPTTGIISGTPTVVGITSASLSASNADGTGGGTLLITTAAAIPPVITSASTAVGMVGQAFTYQITALNSPTGFNATGLPAGLVVNPVTGLISGTPTVAGTMSASLSASNADGTGVGTLLITVSFPVTPQNYTFTTLAGLALNSGSTDATGSAARFSYPHGVAADDAGNVYVADTFNHTIRKVTPGGTVTTLAGLTGVSGSTDGPGSAARFNNPRGVAVDNAGSVYVADSGNHTIRKVTSAGVVSTLAGLALSSGNTDGTGSAARFYSLEGVAVDGVGNVYVGDTFNHTIRMVTSAGVVTTLAGLAGSNGNTDGTGSAARFDFPYGVAVDSASNVYVADSGNNTIRKVTPGGVMAPGWVVTTLAGLAGTPGSSDGTGSAARFDHLYGVAVDNAGSVYVTDADNNTIRKVTSVGVVTTLGGLAGVSGSADGTGSAARFNYPRGMAVDSAGNVYVGDTFNHTIRKGVPTAAVSPPVITSPPVDQIADVGGTVSFSVVTAGTAPLACQWWFNDAPIPGATNKTYTMMNVQANQAGSYRVVVGNEAGSLTSAPAVLKVNRMNQTITFDSLANMDFDNAPFMVNAMASSRLPVSFSILSGPAILSGNMVTLAGVGMVTVRAFQTGYENYNAAPNVDRSFMVAKASQTITFGTLANKATTDPAFGVNATANSQLPVSFSIVSGPARIIGSTITLSGAVGTVVVRAFQTGNANYNAATPVDQSFSVGGMPVVRGEAFADLAGGFQRNKDFNLTLRVRPSNNVQNYSVEEIVPLGWTVKLDSISHGGTFDSTSRKLQWGPFFDTLERACACVLEPGNNTAPAVFDGGVLFDLMFDSATGLQTSGVFVPFSGRRMVARGAFLPENANVGRNVRTEGFRVLVLGEVGKRYDIEACSTPTIPGSWVPVALDLDGSALLDFTDSSGKNSTRRFYRVIER